MALYYPSCAGAIPTYNCNPCPPTETGRVRSVAFVKTTYTFINPSSTAEWTNAIASGDAVVIWQTQGTYDGGATAELVGYGDLPFYNGNVTHTLTFKDPNFYQNCDFYNAMRLSQQYTIWFRTSSLIWASGSAVIVTPKNAVADDINSIVNWEVVCKWTNPLNPCSWTTPASIFDRCYIA